MGASHIEALGKSAGKRAVCLFASDGDAAHSLVESWAATTKPPSTLITLEWDRTPRLSDEVDDTVKALASAATSLHPNLYASAKERANDAPRLDMGAQEISLERAANRAAEGITGVSLHAARSVLRACRRNQLPLLSSLPPAERVRQLALALDPLQLVIELFISEPELPAPGSLLALARGADWLAHNSGARVVVVVPECFAESAAFDHVPCGGDRKPASKAVNLSTEPTRRRRGELDEPVGSERFNSGIPSSSSEPVVSVAAPIGRPHPGSDAEILLHEKLCADKELGPLFSYNQLVQTRHGQKPRVDLLWAEGRLVIELDGHPDHARKRKFCDDRVRDYYLMVSGYQVLRFSDMAILTDVELMVERIRTVVRYLRERAS